jgi:hypothetical protein
MAQWQQPPERWAAVQHKQPYFIRHYFQLITGCTPTHLSHLKHLSRAATDYTAATQDYPHYLYYIFYQIYIRVFLIGRGARMGGTMLFSFEFILKE